ncbi:MAG: YdeI/OmpD-associated family protein [Lachnospiraceae bacterium]|nr:YdeI/OmpD-associated family protein [Lachnospiraceae bacterium]
MRADVPELLFPSRADFRAWLQENAETSEGVWLIFGKAEAVATLSSAEAKTSALSPVEKKISTLSPAEAKASTSSPVEKKISTLSPAEALEEALCFGWIDGQMRSIDETKYHKYFAKRRAKSVWSEKNKQLAQVLRQKGIMTELGEKAVEAAKKNGTWDAPKSNPITDEQIEAFAEKLASHLLAYENFTKMPPSVKRTYTGRYLSFKTEEARERDFIKIIERLNNNLKPM